MHASASPNNIVIAPNHLAIGTAIDEKALAVFWGRTKRYRCPLAMLDIGDNAAYQHYEGICTVHDFQFRLAILYLMEMRPLPYDQDMIPAIRFDNTTINLRAVMPASKPALSVPNTDLKLGILDRDQCQLEKVSGLILLIDDLLIQGVSLIRNLLRDAYENGDGEIMTMLNEGLVFDVGESAIGQVDTLAAVANPGSPLMQIRALIVRVLVTSFRLEYQRDLKGWKLQLTLQLVQFVARLQEVVREVLHHVLSVRPRCGACRGDFGRQGRCHEEGQRIGGERCQAFGCGRGVADRKGRGRGDKNGREDGEIQDR